MWGAGSWTWWSLWILSNLRYFVILISPRKDSEHCASWFYYVKDKILLGYVAAKTHLSLSLYSQKCVCLLAVCSKAAFVPCFILTSSPAIAECCICQQLFLIILLELVWKGQWSFRKARSHRQAVMKVILPLGVDSWNICKRGCEVMHLDLNLKLTTKATWDSIWCGTSWWVHLLTSHTLRKTTP